jgi:hypothetical protein
MISSPSIAPGGQGTTELTANVPSPGLGAWTVDVTYDPTKIMIVSCAALHGGVCSTVYSATTARFTGASATGLIGQFSLGTITLKAAGSSGNCTTTGPLVLRVNVFADATAGAPADIAITGGPTNGTITCQVAATSTSVAPVATATVRSLGPTGTGPTSSDSNSRWIIVVLAGAGLAALASYSALRLRSKATSTTRR